MIRTLTAKIWAKTDVILLACMAIAVPLLWYYGSANMYWFYLCMELADGNI